MPSRVEIIAESSGRPGAHPEAAVGRMLRALLLLGFVLCFVAIGAALADPPMTQLTSDPGSDLSPAWSPDGAWIVFSSDRGGNFDLWLVPAAGGPPIQLTDDPAPEVEPAWSPDVELPRFGGRVRTAVDRRPRRALFRLAGPRPRTHAEA